MNYIILIMCLKIEEPKSKKVVGIQTTFDIEKFKSLDESDSDSKDNNKIIIGSEKKYIKKTDSEDIFVDENGVYHYVIPHCSHCGSTKVTKHDTNLTPIHLKDGTKEYVRVKRYNCKSCGKGSQVEFKDEFKKYSGLPAKLDKIIEELNSLRWISLNDKNKIIKSTLGLEISSEYIRKAQLITDELFWRNPNIIAPDYVNYDVQWIPVDSGWVYLHVLVDYTTKKIIAVELTKDEEKETTKKFFKKVFNVYPKVITTDLKPGYHELIKDELKIQHQECNIHFQKALNDKIKRELNKIKNRNQGNILLENPEISDSKLKEEINKIMEPISEEYSSYKKAVLKAFDFDDYAESRNYINELRIKAKKYPKAIRKYLSDSFFNGYQRLILYKHWDYKGKIPANNNLSETIIGWCASKYEKRKYRTELGFFNHILSRIINQGNI